MIKILFCNIGWMSKYNGIKGDSIDRGGLYNKENIGHEVCNFSTVRGMVYGFVQVKSQIRIENLGAKKDDESISGVTVVWTASPGPGCGTAVVGWYENATVYREYESLPKRTVLQKKNKLSDYCIFASSDDVTLLPPDERTLLIPRSVKGGIGHSNVWYAQSQESKKHVIKVRKLIKNGFLDELPDVDRLAAMEGNARLVTHLKRERDARLVKEKKKEVLKKNKKLCCEVCDFDFKATYGEIAKDFCEVHHLTQLSKSDGEVETTLDDLAIVCSNCHRVIHKQNPMLKIKALKKIIVKYSK